MAVTFPKQRLYHCMNQKATKIPHCPKRAVRLLKMTFRVLLALPLNFSSSCPPPVLFILSTLSCQACLQFSDFAPDFQSFSSVFCFLLCCFIKITIRYTCLEFKMAWSLSSEVYFLYFTSTHVAYAAPEYSIWLAFISLTSMHFKVLENRDYALFIFVFLRPRTMSYTKIMLKICELKKHRIRDHFPLCPFGMLQFVWYWDSSESLLLGWCKINCSFTLLKLATWYWIHS